MTKTYTQPVATTSMIWASVTRTWSSRSWRRCGSQRTFITSPRSPQVTSPERTRVATLLTLALRGQSPHPYSSLFELRESVSTPLIQRWRLISDQPLARLDECLGCSRARGGPGTHNLRGGEGCPPKGN